MEAFKRYMRCVEDEFCIGDVNANLPQVEPHIWLQKRLHQLFLGNLIVSVGVSFAEDLADHQALRSY